MIRFACELQTGSHQRCVRCAEHVRKWVRSSHPISKIISHWTIVGRFLKCSSEFSTTVVLDVYSFIIHEIIWLARLGWSKHLSWLNTDASAKTGEYPIVIFFSARERTEFIKSYKLIASESGWNFPTRSAHYFLERISGNRQSVDDLSTQVYLYLLLHARKLAVSKFIWVLQYTLGHTSVIDLTTAGGIETVLRFRSVPIFVVQSEKNTNLP